MQSRNVIDIAVYRSKMKTMDGAHACPIGVYLWKQYRAAHPEAPEVPPDCSEDIPKAGDYTTHVNACLDCNAV
jgi:hypothetical protein